MNDQLILAALTLAWFLTAMAVAFELARVVSRIRAKSTAGARAKRWTYREGTAGEVAGFVGFQVQ